jgi:sialate O-acetylesterase
MSKIRLFSLLVLSLVFPAFAAAAGLKLAAPFGEFMVLQRDIAVPVWGEADPEAEVTVSFAGQKKATRADASGAWSLKLDPLVASAEGRVFFVSATRTVAVPVAAPGVVDVNANAAAAAAPAPAAPDAAAVPAVLAIPAGPETLELKDVLVGEVWVCSGQSNMEQGVVMKNTVNGAQEADAANFPLIRIRYVDHATSSTPRAFFKAGESGWQPCSPQSIRNGIWGGFSASAYFFGRQVHKTLNVPVGLIQSAWGGTRIEPWTTPAGFRSVPSLAKLAEQKGNRNYTPAALYNAMIHPLVPYAIRGVIWYQGESNLGELDYAEKMRALVQGWRSAWGQGSFPFYYAQLAPFIYRGKGQTFETLPISWEQQTRALEIPNTGMAILNDAGNLRDIHPGDKQTVGARFARLALSRTYGVKFADDSGPLFKAARIAGPGTIVVEFDHAASGLATRDGKAPTHFELAGKDGIFHPATSVKFSGNSAEVFCEELAAVKQVRFAWNQTASPNLVNGEKIPAGAFRWSAVGAGK